MKKGRALLVMIGGLWASMAGAWDANVTNIVHHWNYAAVYLSPDPGPGNCSYGSPYLVALDDSFASKQRFAMLMQALATGQRVSGWHGDPCDTGIWAQSRPRIERLMLSVN
jgi:hypothetical protein